MAFTLITITADEVEPNQQNASGTLTAALSEAISNGVQVAEPEPVSGIITNGQLYDSSGVQPFKLVANNDPATTPQGSTYSFVVQVGSAPVREFTAVVPYNATGATIDLSALDG